MRISKAEPQFNNKNIKFCGNKDPKFISDKSFWWMHNINGAHQRGIIGLTALFLQTPLDYFNPMSDKKTREFSTAKTVVKIVVGTLVGVAVRALGVKYTKKMTETLIKKVKNSKIKDSIAKTMADEESKTRFENNLGTILGLVGVFLTNFTLDMPLAKFAIQKTTEKLNLSEEKSEEAKK